MSELVRFVAATSTLPAAYKPVRLVVDDPEVGESLELTLWALGANVTVHDRASPLQRLPADEGWTLIIDRGLLPADPREYIAGLRKNGGLGVAIVLIEDRRVADLRLDDAVGVVTLEKPFDSRDLIARLPRD